MGVEEFVRRCEDGARHGGGEGVRRGEQGEGIGNGPRERSQGAGVWGVRREGGGTKEVEGVEC